MYIRRDRKTGKNGNGKTYVSVAHNIKVPGPKGKKITKPIVFANLGAEENLDIPTVCGIRDALDRYIQQLQAKKSGEELTTLIGKEAATLAPKMAQLKILCSKDYGVRVLLEPLWKQLGLKAMLQVFGMKANIRFDFERVVFGMVLNRLVDPRSKRACNTWLKEELVFPESEDWTVDTFYRALDILEDNAESLMDGVEEAVSRNEPKENLRLILVDTTSTYFESDYCDVERAEIAAEHQEAQENGTRPPRAPVPQVVNKPPLRMRGHSKDKRRDKPQIMIGVAASTSGRLLRSELYPGNEAETDVTVDLGAKLGPGWGDSEVAMVMDSGMGRLGNLAYIDTLEPPVHGISALPLRKSKLADGILKGEGKWLRFPGVKGREGWRYQSRDLLGKEAPFGRPERLIATRNPLASDRTIRRYEKQLQRIRRVLKKNANAEEPSSGMIKLLSNSSTNRFLRKNNEGRHYEVDTERVELEKKRAGVKILRTTVMTLGPGEVCEAYQRLLKVEDTFRTYKTELKIRPMYHRSTPRIKAHVLMVTLAIVLRQELEHRLDQKFESVLKLFKAVKATRVEQGENRFWQRTEWSTEAVEVLHALGIPFGPKTWGGTHTGGVI